MRHNKVQVEIRMRKFFIVYNIAYGMTSINQHLLLIHFPTNLFLLILLRRILFPSYHNQQNFQRYI